MRPDESSGLLECGHNVQNINIFSFICLVFVIGKAFAFICLLFFFVIGNFSV